MNSVLANNISSRAETKVNPRKVRDLAKGCKCHSNSSGRKPPELQLDLGRDFLKPLSSVATPASSSAAALPGFPPAALPSETAGTMHKSASINGPE